MARRSRNRTRDNNSISRRSLRFDLFSVESLVNPMEDFDRGEISSIHDGRRFDFEAGPESVTSRARTLVVPARAKQPESRRINFYESPPAAIAYERPEEVSVCTRRQTRREVMFAQRHTGSSGQRKPRWTAESHISCARRRK